MSRHGDDKELTREQLDWVNVMRTESGRKVLGRILDYAGVDNDVYDSNTHDHARNAGRREVGLFIRSEMIDADSDGYLKMLKENIDE